jgi:hypothetical protein
LVYLTTSSKSKTLLVRKAYLGSDASLQNVETRGAGMAVPLPAPDTLSRIGYRMF